MSNFDDALRPIAVIGAGFSGTMAAIHLLRKMERRPILLCERASSFARGVAYSTTQPSHLLNVRSANMSAYPDDPDHFDRWINAKHPHDERVIRTPVGTFVSRELYGSYLTAILRDAIIQTDGAVRLRLVPDEVVELTSTDGGYRLQLAGGRSHEIAGAVIAVGNLLRGAGDDRVISNPWDSCFWDRLTPHAPIVIKGTGLTMVDVAVQLKAHRFAGPIIAISRRGLLPYAHVLAAPWRRPDLGPHGSNETVASLLHQLRREGHSAREQGAAWQSVIDSIRPVTATLWQSLPTVEQRRFLRHARPWWDVHRHRMAPPVAEAVRDMLADGYLDVRPGRVLSIEAGEDAVAVEYRPRGTARTELIMAQRVIDATGAVAVSEAKDPLLKSLMAQGLVRLDQHHLGIEVTGRLEVVDCFGRVTLGLWALGPIVRGVFWECTSVPDIRSQAVQVATTTAETLLECEFTPRQAQ